MAFFDHDGGSMHYVDRGCGEALLLIHGLGLSGADWVLQMPILEKRFRTIVPDLPGSGRSSAPRDYSIEGFAESLWSLLDRLEIKRVNLIGFSLGGAVALEMALRRPDDIARLALINSLATYRLDHWRKWIEAHVPAVLVRVLGMRRVARLTAMRLFPEPWQRPIRERAAATIEAVPAGVYLGMGMALQRWSVATELHRVTCRTLVIAAERDYPQLAEKRCMAERLRADFVVMRGSRHATPFDSIDATNSCLIALLTDQPLPPGERRCRDSCTHAQILSIAGAAHKAPLGRPMGSVGD